MSFILVAVFTSVFMIIIGRFMYIQFTGEVQAVDLLDYAEKFRQTDSVIEAERGDILGRTGMVLAGNRMSYSLYAVLDEEYTGNSPTPLHVTDLHQTADKLAPILDMDQSNLLNILQDGKNNDKFQVEFGRFGNDLTEEQKKEIEDLDLPGLYFDERLKRYYPNGPFASRVIGFMQDNEDGQLVGAYGVEEEYEEQLKGENGFVSYERDKYGYKLLNTDEQVNPPLDGHDVYLTIDQKIQTFLEDAMTTVEEEYNPSKMIGIVMNPQTGAVLAMSNRPTFDPNTRENMQNWYNDAISFSFEPGSTMKIFTLAAAIEEGVYNGSETFQSGRYRINENYRYIHDHNGGEGWGEITYEEGVLHSSNVAMAKLLWENLGPDKYLEYLHAFDFNEATGIDLNGEQVGSILYNYPMEQITTSFGQGSTFTPIQIMKAASALANDGKMVKPYVTSRIVNPNNQEIVFEKEEPEYVGQPISADTGKQLKDLLGKTVTSDIGTAQRFQLDNFSTFGKTGTAEIPNPDGGGYLDGAENYTYSFMGMAPKEDPQLAMYIAVKQPEIDYSFNGSKTTSYIYKTVMENSLHYLDVEPDQESKQDIDSVKLENINEQSTDGVVNRLKQDGFNVTVIGNGNRIVDSIPKEGDMVLPNKHIILQTDGQPTMPDLTDWTLREVLSLVELLDLEIDFVGNGFVTNQNIAPQTEVSEKSHLIVELKSKQKQHDEAMEEQMKSQEDESKEDEKEE
ncbi:penicillin-binding protein [Tenuibacillus multivorans]|uniref:serine-type D-Ala-D-Ala carboxypeptidase n=1 Tax=Tenuibacillus multivorans TaxID=237069 RepID=A0A1G9Y6Z5_9BACI|nr:penicillin-binding protein [Tenuibacillus multivorans]GEL75972.1 penicillin-binding protein 2B [Tenuibacillus multivorans]SDN04828.1 penicillin-binding protein 2B [Tenuibacillus multivorans]